MDRVKKRTKKTNRKKNKLDRNLVYSIVLFGLVVGLSYLIFATDILEPKLDSVTASYISFNNSNTTDMLKIENIKKLSYKVGKSRFNTCSKEFNLDGQETNKYQIVLYPIGNDINNKYVNFLLTINKEKKVLDKLDNMKTTKDGGIIIYQGTILKENSIKIQMWIDNTPKSKFKNKSYEIKIESM